MAGNEDVMNRLFILLMEKCVHSSRGVVSAVHNNNGILDNETLVYLMRLIPTNNPFVERVGNSYRVPSHIARYIEDKTVLTDTGGFRYMAA